MSSEAPDDPDAVHALERSVADLRVMLDATPLSLPELLTQAWICGHHAARAALPLGQLFDLLPAPGPADDAWAPHHDEILTAAASAHLAARRRGTGA